jgi:hypothetical protein
MQIEAGEEAQRVDRTSPMGESGRGFTALLISSFFFTFVTLTTSAWELLYVDNSSWARGTAVERRVDGTAVWKEAPMAQQKEDNARQQCRKGCQVKPRKEKEDNARRRHFGFSPSDDNLVCVFCPHSGNPNRMKPATFHKHMMNKAVKGNCYRTNYDDKSTNKKLTDVK